jgi:hypothetical protein
MFSKAFQLAAQFTRPLVVSTRTYDGRVEAGVGAYIVLNREGWIITAAHVFASQIKFNQDLEAMKAYTDLAAEADSQQLGSKERRRKLMGQKPDGGWLTHHSFWWGKDGLGIAEVTLIPGDLAITRLVGEWERPSAYPVLKDPTNMLPGTSLCKLGFPLIEVPCTFDEQKSAFGLSFPQSLAFFPLEGILTRDILATDPASGHVERYIETSSPGLKGQSGGPIFDRDGVVWGMQVRTQHHPLGFDTSLAVDGKTKVGSQFLSVGWGVHAQTIHDALKDRSIAFESSSG